MAKSEDGHYELVLGNRQLVSGFFVLVILFAIFLTLGYILGRNSVVVNENVTAAQEMDTSNPAAQPLAAANNEKPSPATANEEAFPEPPVERSEPAAASQPVENRAEIATTSTKPPQPEPNQSAAAKPAPIKPATTTPATRAEQILNQKIRAITPRKGDVFVQVAAVSRPEAELMGEQLQKRGYRAFISEVPNRDLFRVLVGPFQTNEKLDEVRAQLKKEGIESIVQRY